MENISATLIKATVFAKDGFSTKLGRNLITVKETPDKYLCYTQHLDTGEKLLLFKLSKKDVEDGKADKILLYTNGL